MIRSPSSALRCCVRHPPSDCELGRPGGGRAQVRCRARPAYLQGTLELHIKTSSKARGCNTACSSSQIGSAPSQQRASKVANSPPFSAPLSSAILVLIGQPPPPEPASLSQRASSPSRPFPARSAGRRICAAQHLQQTFDPRQWIPIACSASIPSA
jgi:hypothetical protein